MKGAGAEAQAEAEAGEEVQTVVGKEGGRKDPLGNQEVVQKVLL